MANLQVTRAWIGVDCHAAARRPTKGNPPNPPIVAMTPGASSGTRRVVQGEEDIRVDDHRMLHRNVRVGGSPPAAANSGVR